MAGDDVEEVVRVGQSKSRPGRSTRLVSLVMAYGVSCCVDGGEALKLMFGMMMVIKVERVRGCKTRWRLSANLFDLCYHELWMYFLDVLITGKRLDDE